MPIMTRDEIIRFALLELRKVDAAATLETLDKNDISAALNNLIQTWAALGLTAWKRADQTFSTIASQAGYEIYPDAAADVNAPRPVGIRHVRIQGAPLMIRLTESEWIERADEASGVPKRWHPVESPTLVKLLLSPPPDDAYTISYRYDAPLTEFSAGGDSADVPQAWQEPLILGTAQAIASMYGTDPTKMAPIDARLNALIQGLVARASK